MVFVEAGEFLMGSDDSGRDNQSPEHTVYVDSFWMYKHEVTNTQFAAFLNALGNQLGNRSYWYDQSGYGRLYRNNGEWISIQSYEDYPIMEVSWFGADAYCRWTGGRLPTEAEWEKAARGTDGRLYPWGEGISCNYANYAGCYISVAPVWEQSEGASPYGALNMAGNVWEWVADWYDENYYNQTVINNNPQGPENGTRRSIRGGSWGDYGEDLAITGRYGVDPDQTTAYGGFRCVYDETP
jgi:formylglycine-generating enzyme required for sulfatase activity